MKRFFIGITSVLYLALAVSCATKATPTTQPIPAASPALSAEPAWKTQWDKAVELGKREGKVVIYTIIGSQSRTELSKAFKNRYGLDLEFVPGARGAELTQKLLTERRAGLYLADVVIAGTTDLIPDLKPKGLLEPLDSIIVLPEVLDNKVWRGGQVPFLDKEHNAIGMLTQNLRFMIRNTEQVKEGEITSYRDLLQARWKGKIALRDPTATGAANTWITLLAHKVWGLEETKKYLEQLARMEPAILRDSRLHVEWVAQGKYPVGVATRLEDTAEFIRLGAPITWISAVEGGLISAGSSSLGMVNQPDHPNAAKIFINWLLTREGQTAFIKGYAYPSARLDVSSEGIPTANLPLPNEKFFMDDEENILAKAKMLEVGKEIFGPLLR